jgi:hypothetical protein
VYRTPAVDVLGGVWEGEKQVSPLRSRSDEQKSGRGQKQMQWRKNNGENGGNDETKANGKSRFLRFAAK